MKLQIPFELVKSMNEFRQQINRLDFDLIEWTENGRIVIIPEEVRQEWEMIGLNNTDYPEVHNDMCKKKEGKP